MSQSPSISGAFTVAVGLPTRVFGEICGSPAVSVLLQKPLSISCTKSLSANRGFGDERRVRALSSPPGARGAVSKKMYLSNGGGVHSNSTVFAAERYLEGEDDVVIHSSVETRSDELHSFVQEFDRMYVTHRSAHAGEHIVSASSGDEALALAFSSHGSSFAHSYEESTQGESNESLPCRRDFCKRCCKAASRCICQLIAAQVENRTGIIILQHPLENNHHLGTARIAVVGLRNVELISVPESDEQISCRLRPKVPGSKRQIAGRGGKKAEFLSAQAEASIKLPKKRPAEPKRQMEATIQMKEEAKRQDVQEAADCQVTKMATLGTKHIQQDMTSIAVPAWISLLPGTGLLFPSEHAVDLRPLSQFGPGDSDLFEDGSPEKAEARKPPSQLIVLDGTWSKAKRMFYENPWLHSLPHYRLPTADGASRYGIIRKEPKPGCMSTIESIVLALQLLEPETVGLETLLHVFDLMIQDQKICMGGKYAQLEEKVRNGLSQKPRASNNN